MSSFEEIFQKEYNSNKWEEFIKQGRNLQTNINYQFKNEELLWKALSIRGSKIPTEDIERMEYLGDGLLEAFVTIYLYDYIDKYSPGEMTRYRSLLTDNGMLADIARELNIHEIGKMLGMCVFSQGQASDSFEALVGSIFLDTKKDFQKAMDIVKQIIKIDVRLGNLGDNPWGTKDPKSYLYEWVQKEYKNEADVYFDDRNEGSANAPAYFLKAKIQKKSNRDPIYEGESVGPFLKKKDGEKEAAKSLLIKLRENSLL